MAAGTNVISLRVLTSEWRSLLKLAGPMFLRDLNLRWTTKSCGLRFSGHKFEFRCEKNVHDNVPAATEPQYCCMKQVSACV